MSELPCWSTKGDAYIIFLASDPMHLLEGLQYRKGLSYFIAIQYHDSPVGPYSEVAFITGNFRYKNKSYKNTQLMWVTSEASKLAGIENWALPKEIANIDWRVDQQGGIIQIEKDSQATTLTIKHLLPILRLPVNSNLLSPFFVTQILQIDNFGRHVISQIKMSGKAGLAKIRVSNQERLIPPLEEKEYYALSLSNCTLEVQALSQESL